VLVVASLGAGGFALGRGTRSTTASPRLQPLQTSTSDLPVSGLGQLPYLPAPRWTTSAR
jgi:hypothetical protein